jgi:hypothetical protein
VVLEVFFVAFALVNRATFFDAKPDSPSPTRMPHSRVALIDICVRSFLAIFSEVLANLNPPGTKAVVVVHIWAASMIITSGTLLFSYVYLQPFYSRLVNDVHAVLTAFVFWNSVWPLASLPRNHLECQLLQFSLATPTPLVCAHTHTHTCLALCSGHVRLLWLVQQL